MLFDTSRPVSRPPLTPAHISRRFAVMDGASSCDPSSDRQSPETTRPKRRTRTPEVHVFALLALAATAFAADAPEPPPPPAPSAEVRPAAGYQLSRVRKQRTVGTAMVLIGPPAAVIGIIIADDMMDRESLPGAAVGGVLALTGAVSVLVGPPLILASGFGGRRLARTAWGRAPSPALGLISVGCFLGAVSYEVALSVSPDGKLPGGPNAVLYGAGAITGIVFANRMIRLADGKPLRIAPGDFGAPTAGAPHAWGVVVTGRF